LRLLKDMPHATQVALAFFSHIADEKEWGAVREFRGLRSASNRQQGDNSRRIVRDPRAVQLLAIAAHRNLGVRRKNRVQVRTQRDIWCSLVTAGTDAERVTDLVLV